MTTQPQQDPGSCNMPDDQATLATLKADVKNLNSTIMQMSNSLTEMNKKLDRLTVLEERSNNQKSDVDRAWSTIRDLQDRINKQDIKIEMLKELPAKVEAIQIEMPMLKRGNGIIEKVLLAIATAVGMAILYQVIPH